MVWDPARITPKSWKDVHDFYVELEDRNHDFTPLRQLAAHVVAQPYAVSIGAATSGTALFVAPPPGGDWIRDALRIDLDLSGAIAFARPGSKGKAASFACEDARVIPTFERLLRELSWIAR